MPKRYPVAVYVFVAQKRAEGHPWDKVAELVKQEFHLDRPPSRRQMAKWAAEKTPDMVIDDLGHRLPTYVPAWLNAQQDMIAKLFAEGMRGKDFGLLMAKWMLSEMRAVLGAERLRKAWAEFWNGSGMFIPQIPTTKVMGKKIVAAIVSIRMISLVRLLARES